VGAATTQIVVGALGAVRAMLADFIGGVYIKMYSGTVKSLTEFHERLVLTHHLHFANFLAAKITNNPVLKEDTFSHMAEGLAHLRDLDSLKANSQEDGDKGKVSS
jgi:hypothetical protein